MFINLLSKTHQIFPGINPMYLGTPWGEAFIQPKKETIFCEVFKSVTPTKGTIFCDVYKSINPTKGKIFCDVYKLIFNNPPNIVKLEDLPSIQSIYLPKQVQ